MMSPSSLAHYGLQSSHTPQVQLPHTLLSANGMTNIPKLFVPSVKDPSLLAINGFAVPQTAKLAEKRKLIEEIAHNDVKKACVRCTRTTSHSQPLPRADGLG